MNKVWTTKRTLRIYADTSIFGGCFDEEFAEESRSILQMVQRGEIILLASDLLVDELQDAPKNVRDILENLPQRFVERLLMDAETEQLRDAYLEAGIVGPSSSDDAHHVALATVARADMIVSWNFKHMVHFEKMRGFNAVNLLHGYNTIEIHSPKEVV